MSKKTLNPTERSYEIRKFAEDFASCVYAGDVSSPEGDGGRYAVTSKLREYHHPTMTVPQNLSADARRLLQEIEDNASEADIPTIMHNLEHASSSLQSAYKLVSSGSCRLPDTHRETIKGSHEFSFGEFEQIVNRIKTFDR